MVLSKIDVWNMALDRIGETDGVESEDEDRPAANVLGRHWERAVREVLEARHWPWAIRQRVLSSIDTQTVTYDGDAAQTDFVIPGAYLDTEQIEVVLVAASGTETTPTYAITAAEDGVDAFVTVAAPAVGASLRVTVTTARSGWEHVFALPADCVTPIALLYEDTRYELVSAELRIQHAIMANDAGDGQILCCDLDSDEVDGLLYVAFIDYMAAWPSMVVDALAWRLAIELALAIKKDPALAKGMRDAFAVSLDRASAHSQNLEQISATAPTTPSAAARG